MKILLFLPNYILETKQSNIQGNIIHVKELLHNLSEFAEVYTITANNTIVAVKIPFVTGSINLIHGFIKCIHHILIDRPDIIYTRVDHSFYAYQIAKLFRFPLIIEINGLPHDELKITKIKGIRRQLGNLLIKLNDDIYDSADHLIAVTPGIKKAIETEFSVTNITVIQNGANTDLFKPMNQDKAKEKLKLDELKYHICFVGNFAPWQGVEYLIQTAPYILKTCPDTRFLIIGDGSMKNEWMQLAEDIGVSDKFIFTGSVPYEQVPLYINASDVCVVPKKPLKSGYSPLKLYEYMACSKPIIATRTDGFEILEECDAGILINPANTHEFANAVIKSLHNENLRNQMGAKGREYVVNHSWASVAKKVADVCENVIAEYNMK